MKRSQTVGILLIFAGYTIAAYGVCLLRDYNVPWGQWINPLNPWQWPQTVPAIPNNQIWPSAAAAGGAAAGGAAGAATGPGSVWQT